MDTPAKRAPVILVVSCDASQSAHQLISDILEESSALPIVETEDGVAEYRWNIETKYYTSSVTLSTPRHRTVHSREFSEAVEAVLFYFDSNDRTSFAEVKQWCSTIGQLYTPSVQLLVCNSCPDSGDVPKREVQDFCLKEHFELIEIQPAEVDEEDEEEFGSVHGFQRIRAALKAHMWSNMVMKENPLRRMDLSSSDEEQEGEEAEDTGVSDGSSTAGGANYPDVDVQDERKERQVDVFEQMFSRLHEFRAAAEILPPAQRRLYAEQITAQFWKSLGGDSDDDSAEPEEE